MDPLKIIFDRQVRAVTRAVQIWKIRRDFRPDVPLGQGAVTVSGILRSATGIGEGARLMAVRLSELGYSVGATDLTRASPSNIESRVEGPNITEGDIGGPLLLHANPPLLQRHMTQLRRRLGNRRLIAHWVWELPVLPRSWHRALGLVHEIWAPTRFVADAVASSGTDRPIRVVPYPLRVEQDIHRPMDIAPGRCVFLTMFSDGSGFERKNPVATIKAFRRAFGERQDVLLIVKHQILYARKSEIERQIRDAISGMQNVMIMEGALSTDERDALIARADVMVSLHRSEGFGLTLAEAMLAGKAVVATNWSGNVDFMSPETSALIRCDLVPVNDPEGPYKDFASVWAEPDIDHAASELRRLADVDDRRRLGMAARRASAEYFRPAALGDAVAPTLGLPPHPGPPV